MTAVSTFWTSAPELWWAALQRVAVVLALTLGVGAACAQPIDGCVQERPQIGRRAVCALDHALVGACHVGTSFRVVVQAGRTTEIAVRDGQVAFHRPGNPVLRLSAGSSWTLAKSQLEASVAATPAPDAPASPESAPPAALEPAQHEPPLLPHTRSAMRLIRAAPPLPVPPDASAEAEAEDAAYLHIVALLREGQKEAAVHAALAYLQRFPAGFRRLEIDAVARERAGSASAQSSERSQAGASAADEDD